VKNDMVNDPVRTGRVKLLNIGRKGGDGDSSGIGCEHGRTQIDS
jgi:hypothetical protein